VELAALLVPDPTQAANAHLELVHSPAFLVLRTVMVTLPTVAKSNLQPTLPIVVHVNVSVLPTTAWLLALLAFVGLGHVILGLQTVTAFLVMDVRLTP
jgi:hypothetical protein